MAVWEARRQYRLAPPRLRYVVVPLFDGDLKIDTGDGPWTIAAMKNGVPYFRKAGVEHDVINGNDFACAFIEIEILG